MLDQDDGDALRREAPDHGHAAVEFARAQPREPFVQQKHTWPGGKRTRQLDPLLLDIGELIEPVAGLEQQIELAENAGGLVLRVLVPLGSAPYITPAMTPTIAGMFGGIRTSWKVRLMRLRTRR